MISIDEELARDRAVIAAATSGPWEAHVVDDHMCMNARTITRIGGSGELGDHEDNIAITLLQEPRFADIADRKWDQNAEFIVRARDRWPKAIERIALLKKEILELESKLAETSRK